MQHEEQQRGENSLHHLAAIFHTSFLPLLLDSLLAGIKEDWGGGGGGVMVGGDGYSRQMDI